MFYYKRIVYHIEHLDDTSRTNVTFRHSCIERITTKIVEPVHIELTGDQLVQEVLRVLTLEDRNSQVQLPVEMTVDFFHHQQRDLLMRNIVDEGIFQDMREGTVTDIVHQDGRLDCFCFGVKDEISLLLERPHSLGHQVKSTDGMLKSCMTGTGIDHRCQSQLVDAVETLEQRMLNDAVEQSTRYLDKSEYRVVDNLSAVHLII